MGARHRSLRFGTPEVLVLASLAASLYLVLQPRGDVHLEITREGEAIAAVRAVAEAEHRFLAQRMRDENRDAAPEYGRLADLLAAGLLSQSPKADGDGSFAEVAGYRVEVLLPDGRDRAGRITLARSGKAAAPELAADTFAVVATPLRGASSGRRSLYLDAAGRLFVADGVCQVVGDRFSPPPPRVLKEKDEDLGPQGPVWHLIADPTKREGS